MSALLRQHSSAKNKSLSKKLQVLSQALQQRKSVKTCNVISLSLLLVFGIAYILQMNGMATKGYEIADRKATINELKETVRDLELETLELKSLSTIEKKVQQLDMVAVGTSVEHLQPTPVAAAR